MIFIFWDQTYFSKHNGLKLYKMWCKPQDFILFRAEQCSISCMWWNLTYINQHTHLIFFFSHQLKMKMCKKIFHANEKSSFSKEWISSLFNDYLVVHVQIIFCNFCSVTLIYIVYFVPVFSVHSEACFCIFFCFLANLQLHFFVANKVHGIILTFFGLVCWDCFMGHNMLYVWYYSMLWWKEQVCKYILTDELYSGG